MAPSTKDRGGTIDDTNVGNFIEGDMKRHGSSDADLGATYGLLAILILQLHCKDWLGQCTPSGGGRGANLWPEGWWDWYLGSGGGLTLREVGR